MANSDVIIIGGGINGVSIAYHMAKHGIKALLLEKLFIAGGPTGRSSAIIRQHYSNLITAQMALDSLHVWQNFSEIIGGEAGYTKTGIMIGVERENVEALRANIKLQRSIGINTFFITPQEINEFEPQIAPEGLGGAAYEPDGGYCDPATAANSFAQAAIRLGAEIRTGVAVTGFRIKNGKVSGVETDQGFISTRVVVIAAGPWSVRLLANCGFDVPIITARVKVALFQHPHEFQMKAIWADFITQVYQRPETGNLMLVGTISPDEETKDTVKNPDDFNDHVQMETISNYAERISKRYPGMRQSNLVSSFASLYDITPDWHAIMDEVPGIDGLFLCAGSSGHGFKLAPAVGRMMTKLILSGKNPGDDITFFSFGRFSQNKLIRGKYDYSILG